MAVGEVEGWWGRSHTVRKHWAQSQNQQQQAAAGGTVVRVLSLSWAAGAAASLKVLQLLRTVQSRVVGEGGRGGRGGEGRGGEGRGGVHWSTPMGVASGERVSCCPFPRIVNLACMPR